jgi:hypothetical protein
MILFHRLNFNFLLILVQWLAFLLRVRGVPGKKFGLKTSYPEGIRGFTQFFQANAGIVP